MNLQKIKTLSLLGKQLDWAVAKCEGFSFSYDHPFIFLSTDGSDWRTVVHELHRYKPSSYWLLAGPIIERENITIIRCDDDYGVDSERFCTNSRIPVWAATIGQHGTTSSTEHQHHEEMFQIVEDDVVYGPTCLIAAMRCYVASKLGNTVEIPEVLA